jgi:hypothetical protein
MAAQVDPAEPAGVIDRANVRSTYSPSAASPSAAALSFLLSPWLPWETMRRDAPEDAW